MSIPRFAIVVGQRPGKTRIGAVCGTVGRNPPGFFSKIVDNPTMLGSNNQMHWMFELRTYGMKIHKEHDHHRPRRLDSPGDITHKIVQLSIPKSRSIMHGSVLRAFELL